MRESVQLDQILREALTLLRASLPSTITLQYYGKPGGGPILADPAQMHQVVMHLGANAADAMRQTGGRLEVSLDTVHVLAEAADPPYLSPGAYVRIRVRDTGCGMSPEVQERIFEPFSRPRMSEKGPDWAWRPCMGSSQATAGPSRSAVGVAGARLSRSICPSGTGLQRQLHPHRCLSSRSRAAP